MNLTNSNRGFSLVELVIAMALFVFLFATGFMVVKSMFQSSTTSMQQSKANDKLKTVAAMIQNEAATIFDTLEETNRDRTGYRDPHIRITSTIGPISSTDRTRPVTLVASYETSPGNVTQKTMSFSLSNNLSGFAGAGLKVKIVSSVAGVPVAGVYVRAPGQNIPQVEGVTGANGECILYGVSVSCPTSRATLDGEGVVGHFVPNPPSFLKLVDAFNMQVGQMRDLGTHAIILPLTGRVRLLDSTNNLPVANAHVRLFPRPGGVPIGTCNTNASCWLGGGYLSGLTSVAPTDANGIAEFPNLIQGDYYVLVLGNNEYAAADKCLTSPGNNSNRNHVTFYTEQNNPTVDAYTIKKGSLRAQVGYVEYSGGEFTSYLPAKVNASFDFLILDRYSYQFDFSSPYNAMTSFDWQYSLAHNFVTPGSTLHTGTVDSSGILIVNNIGPKIINSSWTLPSNTGAERQGIYTTPFPGVLDTNQYVYKTPAPYMPVLVRFHDNNPKDPRFLLISNPPFLAKTAPSSTLSSYFQMKLFTNEFNLTNGSQEILLMKYSDKFLSRATGYIVEGGTNTFETTSFAYKAVRANWGWATGSGGIVYDSALDSYYIDAARTVATTIINPSAPGEKHRFVMPDLFPSIDANDKQGFYFEAQPSSLVNHANTNFYIPVKVWTKNASGGMVQEANPNSGATFTLRFKYPAGGANFPTEFPDQTNVGITNGVISFNDRTTYSSEFYRANIPPQTLPPGEEVDFGNTVVERVSDRRAYGISVVSESSNQFDYLPPTFLPDVGYSHVYNQSNNRYQPGSPSWVMQLARRASTHLSVIVQTIGGQRITNATVVLEGHGMSSMTTTTNTNGVYEFPNSTSGSSFSFSYFPVPHNLWVRVTAPGYAPSGNQYLVTNNPLPNPFVIVQTMILGAGSGGSN